MLYGIKQIYKDWANHYLEKYLNKSGGKTFENGLIKSKGFIKDLSRDLQDGILLVGIIESFSKHRVNLNFAFNFILHSFYYKLQVKLDSTKFINCRLVLSKW